MGPEESSRKIKLAGKEPRKVDKSTYVKIPLISKNIKLKTLAKGALVVALLCKFNIFNFTLADRFFIKNTIYFVGSPVGYNQFVDFPTVAQKFNSPEEIIKFVKNISYNDTIDNPIEVYRQRSGSNLGKARLAWWMGIKNGYTFHFKIYNDSRVTIIYKGKEYGL